MGCDLVVVGCCDLIVWVRFCWINGDLGEDLGLVVVGCDWCWVGHGAWVWWVCGGLGEELGCGLLRSGCLGEVLLD